MTGLSILIFFGSQIAIGSGIGSILGWETGKKINYKLYGERSRFIPKDAIIKHKTWSEIK